MGLFGRRVKEQPSEELPDAEATAAEETEARPDHGPWDVSQVDDAQDCFNVNNLLAADKVAQDQNASTVPEKPRKEKIVEQILTDGSDFVRVASITVAAGQSQASFSISTLDDALAEGAEQFTVSLARVEAPGFEATAIDPARSAVTTTITDDTGPGGSTPHGRLAASA